MNFLGIDVGTGGSRAVLINADGEVIASATVEHIAFASPEIGWAEQNAEDWWKASSEAIRRILTIQNIKAEEIGAIGLSGQMHGAVFLDESDKVLRPSIIWCDQRTERQCDDLTGRIGAEKLIELVSNPALPNFTLTKMLWVRENEPKIWNKTRTVLLPKDYLRFRLTGEKATDVSDASGTLLLDVQNRKWSSELLAAVDMSESLLPKLYESAEITGTISARCAAETGLKEGTKVVAGAGDNAAGAIGMRIVKVGAVGDINNDGFPDIYVTCLGGNVLYQNNGDGTFMDVTKKAGVADGRWSVGAAFGDYDGDSLLDLIVVNYVDFKFNDLPSFGSLPTCKFRGVDVQCGPRGLKGAGDSLFKNNVDGTFTDVSKQTGLDDADGYYGMQPIWSDFGNTGRFDVYISNDSTPNYFYRNEGKGKFAEDGLISGTAVSGDGSEQGSMGIAVGDYNHSGNFSIYTTIFVDEYNTLYRNNGKYDFTDVSFSAKVAQTSRPYVGWGTGFFDLDNDTWLDLFVVNGHVYPQMDEISSGARYKQGKLLYINKGDGTFCDATEQGGAVLSELRVSRGAAFGDLDNDGQIDIVVEDLDASPMILHNEGDKSNHWITFELAAKKGNPLAIGARIKITTGKTVQIEEIRSGGSYLSQNDLRVHFGLGKAAKVDEIEIRWNSGKVETIKNVAADKFYGILEGEGIVSFEKVRPSLKKKN